MNASIRQKCKPMPKWAPTEMKKNKTKWQLAEENKNKLHTNFIAINFKWTDSSYTRSSIAQQMSMPMENVVGNEWLSVVSFEQRHPKGFMCTNMKSPVSPSFIYIIYFNIQAFKWRYATESALICGRNLMGYEKHYVHVARCLLFGHYYFRKVYQIANGDIQKLIYTHS